MSLVDRFDELAVHVPTRRSGHVSVALGNTVLVWGGYSDLVPGAHNDERYLPSNEVWLYDCEIERWFCQSTHGESPPGLSGAGAALIGCKMYLVCGFSSQGDGNNVYILDTRNWQWSSVVVLREEDRPSPRDKFSAWEYNNMLYIFGGYGMPIDWFLHDHGSFFEDPTMHPYHDRGWNNQLLIFNPTTSQWENPRCLGSIPSPRAAHAVAKFDEKLYLFGGRHNEKRLNDLYHLDLSSLTWSRVVVPGELPAPRTWHIFCPVSSHGILLYGGYSQNPPAIENGVPLDDAWTFDIEEHRWTEVTGFKGPACLWHSGVRTSNESVVIFGGCTSNIFDETQPKRHSNQLSIFRQSPKSLFNLSLDACFTYRDALSSEWNQLPYRLNFVLNDRLERQRKTCCAYCKGRRHRSE